MRVTLIFPPFAEATMPRLALPTLAATLRREGHAVELRDDNLNVLEEFLTPEYMRQMQSKCLEALEAWRPGDAPEHLKALLGAVLVADEVIAHIPEALAALRSHSPLVQRLWAQRLIVEALRLIHAVYYPTRLTLSEYITPYSAADSGDVLKATEDRKTNPFIQVFAKRIVPEILAFAPDIVGLSVMFPSQLIPAMTLARCLRQTAGPRKPFLLLGGGLMTKVAGTIPDDFLREVDGCGLFEGEVLLPPLLSALAAGSDLSQVPNLLTWFGGKRVQTACQPLNLSEIPPPDFSGYQLARYLSSEPVIPLQTARGCYWGHCTFCSLHSVDGPAEPRYRETNVATVVAHIARLAASGYRRFFLVDECIPPARLTQLAQQILAQKLDIRWFFWARFEHAFDAKLIQLLAQAGCAMISFGLESAVPKVLQRMAKGQSLDEVERIVEACNRAGIAVIPNFFIGFPGETKSQAEQTVDYILRNADHFRHVVGGVFTLERFSPIEQHPQLYGLTDVAPEGDLAVNCRYRPTDGMDRDEIQAMAKQVAAKLAAIYHPILGTLADVDAIKHEDLIAVHTRPTVIAGPLVHAEDLGILRWSIRERVCWQLLNGSTGKGTVPLSFVGEPHGAMILDRATGRRFLLGSTAYQVFQACDGQRDESSVAQVAGLSIEQVKSYLVKLAAEGVLLPVAKSEPKGATHV